MSIKSEIAKEYLKRFPSTASSSLARKIYKENNVVFKNEEDARDAIRYNRGKKGAKQKDNLSDKSFTNQQYNPYNLPESDEEEYTPYILPVVANNILALFDVHIPYHNIPALTAALDYGKENDINTILLGGDIMDCYQASSFEKDPRKRSLKDEFQMTRDFFSILRKNFPKAKIYFKIGNHEERWERMLRTKAPEILDMDEFRLDVILRFAEYGIELIGDKKIIHAGKLNILHGHEFRSGMTVPVNPARGYYMKAKESMIAGHNHQTSSHSESSLNGSVVSTFSVGCLSDLHPRYNPINKWNHGFAHITVNKDKTFVVKNLKIINGKIY